MDSHFIFDQPTAARAIERTLRRQRACLKFQARLSTPLVRSNKPLLCDTTAREIEQTGSFRVDPIAELPAARLIVW